MQADGLSPGLWNAIADLVSRQAAPSEISFHPVKRRDVAKKVIWVDEFGETGVPLAAFDFSFSYYDTQNDGTTLKRQDKTAGLTDPAYHTAVVVPRVGQTVAILNPAGNRRFPVCVGVIQSSPGAYWQGE